MVAQKGGKGRPNHYLPLILCFIFADIVCDNYIFRSFHSQKPTIQILLFTVISFIQMIAAPIQAAFSDLYCRKKSLLIALTASCISLLLMMTYNSAPSLGIYFLAFFGLLKGFLGNTFPLALAAVADTQEKNFRFSFGLSSSSFAIGYIVLVFINKHLTTIHGSFLIASLYLILILLCGFLFLDIRDKENPYEYKEKNSEKSILSIFFEEIKLITGSLKNSKIRNGLIAFFFWEASLYSILLLYVDFDVTQFSTTALWMMFGYLLGVTTLRFCDRIKDETIIKWGYAFSVLSLIPVIFFYLKNGHLNYNTIPFFYFLHTLGNAFLCPTFFAMLSKGAALHEQGKVYGLIGAVDTFAFFIASFAVMTYASEHMNLFFVIAFSFFTACASWIPYKKFMKIHKL